ncbi:hypothetical protein [Lacisediminihabitans sp. H27-G8]|uniref:hypothetical protein n=1 Tax=Lacisediminihabitans sp. H27-G8 TaxID=3111909 RepID=UPI0038FC4B87
MSDDFGIGAQVVVRAAGTGELAPWPDEPSGVIVRSGGSALAGVWGRGGGGRMWWVEFDEPQTNSDGDGPFPSAQVHEKFLELAPPVSDQE